MLDYLLPFKDHIEWEKLISLKKERDSWWERKSSQKWTTLEYPNVEKLQAKTNKGVVQISSDSWDPSSATAQEIELIARQLIPWKKGPFELFHLKIDAEWRSDLKWSRVLPHLPNLKDKVILDIGCNNGYFLFQMDQYQPQLALGIDPVLQIQAQFNFIQHYFKSQSLKFELFGIEHLCFFREMFDVIFSMGIIYHHRNPIKQLIDIRNALKPGGTAILETIGIPGQDSYTLFPEDRYARMGNVWFVPTLSCFINWAKKARFIAVECISDTDLTEEEQRNTPWCPRPFQSLQDSLDPKNSSLTIEGYPAPRRFMIKVKKRG